MAIFWFESDTKTQGGVWGEAVSASLCGQHGDGQSRISTNASCQVFAPQTMLLHLHLKADDYVTWWPTDEVNSICQPIFDLFQANSNPVGETLHKGVKSTNKSELGDLVPSPFLYTSFLCMGLFACQNLGWHKVAKLTFSWSNLRLCGESPQWELQPHQISPRQIARSENE